MGQTAQEKGYAHKGIAPIVTRGIDDTAVAFAANHGPNLLHLGGDIDLAHSRSGIVTAMTLGDIAQGTGGTEVAHRVAGSVREHIVGHADKGVLLAEHPAVFLNKGQTVYIRVYHNAHVVAAFLQFGHDAAQILLQRLGVVGKIAIGLAVEKSIFHAQTVEQPRQNDAAHGVDGIYSHLEVGLADGLNINEPESQHSFNVAVVESAVVGVAAEMVHIGKLKVFTFGNSEHLVAIVFGEKFPFMVEQFQSVPMAGIMRGCDDDATGCPAHAHGQFGGGSGGGTDVDHIISHAHERATNHVFHHEPRNAGIAAHNNLVAV